MKNSVIEKMKCCGNCKHWLDEDEQHKYQECTESNWWEKCYKWELAE